VRRLALLLLSVLVALSTVTTCAPLVANAADAVLPDLAVQSITVSGANKLVIAVVNSGKGYLPKVWSATADVYFDQVKKGFISLTTPTSTTGGGISVPAGTSTYVTAWDVLKTVTVMVVVDPQNWILESNEQNNSRTTTLSPSVVLPDLMVQSISLAPGNKATFTVLNNGQSQLPGGWTAVADVYFNQVKKGSVSLTTPSSNTGGGIAFPAGTSTFITSWEVTSATSVMVVVDTLDNIAESNEQNNALITGLSPQPDPPGTSLPDLVVTGITTGIGNRLAVIIRNTGKVNLPVGSRGVADVFVNGQKLGFFDLGKPTESFFGGIGAAGGFSSYLLNHVVMHQMDVQVVADATGTIAEINEQNNLSHEVVSSRDAASGLPSGRKRTMSFQIGNTSYQVDAGNRSMDVPPIIVESRTLMPVRFVVEPLGAKVGWNGTTRKVTITLGLKTIELWIDGSIARISGSTIYIDPSNPKVAPFISDSRTYLPLRFVSEVCGGMVTWVPETRSILLDFSSAVEIDDDVSWSKVDAFGNQIIDDEVVWQRFGWGVNRIDDDVTWMKDGRSLRHVRLLTDPAYGPVGVIDPDPPTKPTEVIDPEPPS